MFRIRTLSGPCLENDFWRSSIAPIGFTEKNRGDVYIGRARVIEDREFVVPRSTILRQF